MEELLKVWTSYLASGVEGIAALLIALAAVQAAIHALFFFFRDAGKALSAHEPGTEYIRLRFGRWLALALEFELGADILRTAIAPTWSDIGQLAAIATIRTVLNYFLQKEIDRAVERQPEGMLSSYTPPASPPSPSSPSDKINTIARKIDNAL